MQALHRIGNTENEKPNTEYEIQNTKYIPHVEAKNITQLNAIPASENKQRDRRTIRGRDAPEIRER